MLDEEESRRHFLRGGDKESPFSNENESAMLVLIFDMSNGIDCIRVGTRF